MENEVNPSQYRGRLEFLDCARGFAALLVLVSHTLSLASSGYFIHWCNLGIIGVALFFFVSGFIIPISLNKGGVRRFAISRFFRLYPLYWLSLALALLILFPGEYLLPDSWRVLLANVSMFQAYFNQPDILGVYWTLGVELGFYILCLVCFKIKILRHGEALAWIAVSGLIVLTLISWFVFQKAILPWLSIYIVIALVGNYFHQFSLSGRTFKSLLPFLIFFSVANVLHAYMVIDTGYFLGKGLNTPTVQSLYISRFIALGFFLFLFGCRSKPFPKFLLNLGIISYSIYLLHPFVVHWVPISYSDPVRVAWVIGGSVVISILSYHYLEKPSVGLGKKIIARCWPKGSAQPGV